MTETELCTAIATHLFGWRVDDAWGCLVPSGWPSHQAFHSASSQGNLHEVLHTMERIRGDESSGVGADGRPTLPAYLTDPRATARVWAWLEDNTSSFRMNYAIHFPCELHGYMAEGYAKGDIHPDRWCSSGECDEPYSIGKALALFALALYTTMQEEEETS